MALSAAADGLRVEDYFDLSPGQERQIRLLDRTDRGRLPDAGRAECGTVALALN